MEKCNIDLSDVKFENKENFDIMVISPNKIENLDYNDPGYLTKLVNESFNKTITTNPDSFFDVIAENLDVNNFEPSDRNVTSHVIYDKPEYFYEIFFLEVLDEKKHNEKYENQFSNMINFYGEKIYGNMIILKTYIPSDNSNGVNMVLDNMSQKDLYEILDSRVNTKVVVLRDDEYREEIVRGDIDVFCKSIFGEEYYHKKEVPFLLHNLNIYYLKDEYGTQISKNLLPEKVESAVFFTMNNESFRGNITLDELKKILKMSTNADYFKPRKEWIEDEKDFLDRQVIKNKYKILDYAWKDFNKNKVETSN